MEVLVYGKYCNSNDMDAMETVHHTYIMNETPEEKNNGYVVFKWNIRGSAGKEGGCEQQQSFRQIFKDDVNVFFPPRIFAPWLTVVDVLKSVE